MYGGAGETARCVRGPMGLGEFAWSECIVADGNGDAKDGEEQMRDGKDRL